MPSEPLPEPTPNPSAGSSQRPPSGPSSSGTPRWLPLAAGAALVVIAVVLFLALRGGDDDDKTNASAGTSGPTGTTRQIGAPCGTPPSGKPAAAVTDVASETTTAKKVVGLSTKLGLSIYWAGAVGKGTDLEVTQNPNGVFLRYLTGGAKPGDKRPEFLSIGSYPQADPLATVCQALQTPGTEIIKLPMDGLAVSDPKKPKSVYLAYPKNGTLVEVFSPTDGRAKTLVQSGRIRPVTA